MNLDDINDILAKAHSKQNNDVKKDDSINNTNNVLSVYTSDDDKPKNVKYVQLQQSIFYILYINNVYILIGYM